MSEILCPWERLSNYITLTLTINNGIQLTSFDSSTMNHDDSNVTLKQLLYQSLHCVNPYTFDVTPNTILRRQPKALVVENTRCF